MPKPRMQEDQEQPALPRASLEAAPQNHGQAASPVLPGAVLEEKPKVDNKNPVAVSKKQRRPSKRQKLGPDAGQVGIEA